MECPNPGLKIPVVCSCGNEDADAPDPFGLLRPYWEWPCRHRGPEKRNELASPHSITSSASSKNDSRTERPSALAVLRLITNSYLIGDCAGKLPGDSPLRMRST